MNNENDETIPGMEEAAAIVETATSNNTLMLDDLDDDCLIHIFNFLPFIDRMKIEQVCERWRELSKISWSGYSRYNRCLVIGGDTGSFPCEDPPSNTPVLEKILRLRGSYLEEIYFSKSCRTLSDGTVAMIARVCPRIKIIHLENLRVTTADLRALASRCRNIEVLSINSGMSWCETALHQVIEQNPRLRSLTIINNDDFTGSCLEELDMNVIESLTISDCLGFRLTSAIVQRMSLSLTELKIHNRYLVDESYNYISRLYNLRRVSLILPCTPLVPWIMENIACNCTLLEVVELFSPAWFTRDEEIKPILEAPKLRELILHGREAVTDSLFDDRLLLNLERLIMPCSSKVKEAGMRDVVTHVPNLKFLEVCECTLDYKNRWVRECRQRGLTIKVREALTHSKRYLALRLNKSI